LGGARAVLTRLQVDDVDNEIALNRSRLDRIK
jgi:hypothetical protein